MKGEATTKHIAFHRIKWRKSRICLGGLIFGFVLVFITRHCAVKLPWVTATLNGETDSRVSAYRVLSGGYLISLPDEQHGYFVYVVRPKENKVFLPNQSFIKGIGFMLYPDSPPAGVLLGSAKADEVPPAIVSNSEHFAFTIPYPKQLRRSRVQVRW